MWRIQCKLIYLYKKIRIDLLNDDQANADESRRSNENYQHTNSLSVKINTPKRIIKKKQQKKQTLFFLRINWKSSLSLLGAERCVQMSVCKSSWKYWYNIYKKSIDSNNSLKNSLWSIKENQFIITTKMLSKIGTLLNQIYIL